MMCHFCFTLMCFHPLAQLRKEGGQCKLNISGTIDLVGITLSISFTQSLTFGQKHHSLPYNILCDSLWGYIQMTFFLGIPKWESQNWDFYCPEILDAHIFFKLGIFLRIRRQYLISFKKIFSTLYCIFQLEII